MQCVLCSSWHSLIPFLHFPFPEFYIDVLGFLFVGLGVWLAFISPILDKPLQVFEVLTVYPPIDTFVENPNLRYSAGIYISGFVCLCKTCSSFL